MTTDHCYAPGEDSRCVDKTCDDPYNIDGTHDNYWTNKRLVKVMDAIVGPEGRQ